MPRIALVLIAGALVLSSCGLVPGGSSLSGEAGGPSGAVTEARVVWVVDGDTIRVEIGGADLTVRYIGVNAAERGDRCSDAATDLNAQLVAGQTVWLERDVSDTDRFDRLLRYVWLQPRQDEWLLVNEELVRRGAAEARTYRPDVRRQPLLDAAERDARNGEIGCLWSDR